MVSAFKRFKGSCTGNTIISGKPWAMYKIFCDKFNLHTKLYISSFYKKNCILKNMSEKTFRTFFCGNSLPNTTLVKLVENYGFLFVTLARF